MPLSRSFILIDVSWPMSLLSSTITFKDGLTVGIIVGTPKNLEYLMAKDRVNFYGPGLPWIIVKELTVETIHEAIQGYMDDCPNGY